MMVPSNTTKKLQAEKIRKDMEAYLQNGGEVAEHGAGQSRLNAAVLLTSYNDNYAKDPAQRAKHKAKASAAQAAVFNKRGVERERKDQ